MAARDPADTTTELADALRMAVGPLARQLRQQASEPLTATQTSVVSSICRWGPISLGELAAREQLSPPMISKVVAALEHEGFVERLADARDRRVCRVRLSSEGVRWVEEGRARRNAWLAGRLAALTTAERETIASAVQGLQRLIDDDAP